MTTVRQPLVSVVIPCHNAASWLGETLESVIAQTWLNREVLLIDDGSTDDSLTIARRFEDRGVRVVTQPNRGAAAARNHGLRLARGEFVKFLDADDLLSPSAIAAQVAALEERPRSIAHGRWARFHEDPATAVFTPHPGWHDADDPVAWIKETWSDARPMYQCGLFLITRGLLEATGGWDERLSLIDDFEFFTRLVLASDGLVFTPEAQLYYRSGMPGRLSGRTNRTAWASAVASTFGAVEHLRRCDDTPETRRLAANMLQSLVYTMYPSEPDLILELERTIEHLGGANLTPDGGPMFGWLARIIGWKPARRLQTAVGRFPSPE